MYQQLKSLVSSGQPFSYKNFVEAILYTPEVGYYTCRDNQVGRQQDSDFYTAQSLNTKVFQKLVIEAALSLLPSGAFKSYNFIEIGSQLSNPLIKPNDHSFKNHQVITPFDPIDIPSQSIVFANELLDAQPFHRLVFKNGAWHELGVHVHEDLTLSEQLLPTPSLELKEFIRNLPMPHVEGYQLDIPLAAESLLGRIVTQPWRGLLMLFDYGLTWRQLLYERPQGTARAYHRHQLSTDLLACPGKQDLTCHICWDRLIPIIRKNGFTPPRLQSQESFFMHYAQLTISSILTDNAGGFSSDRQSLKELIHPSHMGQKFQILHAVREKLIK